MPWTFQQKLRVGFWLLAFVPVILGVVAYRNAYSAAAAADDVARTNDIVKSLEAFLSDLKDIEVAQREFVLTGDERHAMIIDRSRARFETGLQRLRQMRAERHWMELLEIAASTEV
jgi:CHASE3 domain sensor protein